MLGALLADTVLNRGASRTVEGCKRFVLADAGRAGEESPLESVFAGTATGLKSGSSLSSS